MSKRKTDNFDDVHFSSDRFFFADGKWNYYLRTYNGDLKTITGFDTKEAAENNCTERFSNKIDYFFHGDTK